eukprot:2650034-Amphidinium_carterae.1
MSFAGTLGDVSVQLLFKKSTCHDDDDDDDLSTCHEETLDGEVALIAHEALRRLFMAVLSA